ncbi:MAG: hypothetical protein QGI10_15295 [Vicinamibacterales bacterium]|jgi:hypothetical protein|nr:hypothetical protein [Vicinamibacterales bacterium]HJN45758.1 hypothetical protein [Vicinamibacterales bacterium]|tara:strand:+ start:2609 stop:2779 length:171 start_codon:yes stop_codon:yes gene_type:complete
MTTSRDCSNCNTHQSIMPLTERSNPDGSVTAWLVCSCCLEITKVVDANTVLDRRAA